MLSRASNGVDDPTAVGNAGMLCFAIISFGMGTLWVVNTLVSQSFGRKTYSECGRYLWRGCGSRLYSPRPCSYHHPDVGCRSFDSWGMIRIWCIWKMSISKSRSCRIDREIAWGGVLAIPAGGESAAVGAWLDDRRRERQCAGGVDHGVRYARLPKARRGGDGLGVEHWRAGRNHPV